MTQRIYKLVLTSHITFSVGWLGAVAVFIALAIASISAVNIQLAQSAYHAMEISTRYVIIPFCLASLISGVIQASVSKWGFFKYYWIVVKLFITIAMTVLLFLHLQPISYLANTVTDSITYQEHVGLAIDLIKKAVAALLGLFALTTISIYKPWGKIDRVKEIDEPIKNSSRLNFI